MYRVCIQQKIVEYNVTVSRHHNVCKVELHTISERYIIRK